MSVIIVPGQAGSFLTFYDELAHLSGGRAHVVKEESVMRKYLKIIRAFDDINKDSNSAVIVHQEIKYYILKGLYYLKLSHLSIYEEKHQSFQALTKYKLRQSNLRATREEKKTV